ncbi:MAG: FAD-dependent oxidoreductase [Pseudomonadota bacterium]
MADAGIVIIGGGQAAASAIAEIRKHNSDVPVTLVTDEPVLPYQRPPLSKAYLKGELEVERLLLRPRDWYDDNNIAIRDSLRIESLDREAQTINAYDGTVLSYDRLLLATGARPRRLPPEMGGHFEGVFVLRSKRHADGLASAFATGEKLVVIGGGYVGLEVAAVAAQAGKQVAVVEMADRILQRVASPETSAFYRHLHESHGVRLLEGTGISELTGQGGRVTGAKLSDGEYVEADTVLVGIGVTPRSDLAEMAGLHIENGIAVDGDCCTSAPAIFAAGDCASIVLRDERTRIESVPNAIQQGEAAARAMLGLPADYQPKPWFWSDQYDVKLQIAGLNAGYDSTVTRPGKREGSQSVWYYGGEQLLAVDAMNDAPSFMMARRILEAGGNVPKGAAADPTSNLKEFA